jgi:transcriptional regulator GlxA family with amidase domain
MEERLRVAVVLYPKVEPIDLAVVGVLSMAKRVTEQLEYFTVAEHGGTVELQNGLTVQVDYSFERAPRADVIIVTGGPGWTEQVANPRMHAFLKERAESGDVVASVCTGALVLGAAGLLDGKQATTKYQVVPPEENPLHVLAESFGARTTPALVVDEGAIVTGGGVTLGIDTTLYLLERFLGENVANETARIMEYTFAWKANRARLPVISLCAASADS